MNPTIIRALVYAGILYHSLMIIVCVWQQEYLRIIPGSVGLVAWWMNYYFHKKKGTW